MTTAAEPARAVTAANSLYEKWIQSLGVPIYRDYYIEDLRTVKLGRWEERQVDAAIMQLVGQQGLTSNYVNELRPGGSSAPFKIAVDEAVYVLDGRGLATIQAGDGPSKTFEWQKHSMFLVPANYTLTLSNAQGNQPARLLHFNFLSSAMVVVPNLDFFLNNPIIDREKLSQDFYSEAKSVAGPDDGLRGVGKIWVGNFFPDLRAWDRLDPYRGRGAGGTAVFIEFPGSPVTAHMSVFPSRTYKKGHRHGPGVTIVIPTGEGYSIMWPEGGEKVVVPWHEASLFVPPNRWFHQHFNGSGDWNRYLAFHGPRIFAGTERVEDTSRDQIEYPDEEPFIRQKFEEELGKRGLTSLMIDDAYKDKNYQWKY